jgi:putative PIN family toxin of toxin-antitoxin system
MANRSERVVIDTNIFIYFLISDTFQKFDKHLKNHDVTLLFSEELLYEFMEVVNRPKFRKYFSKNDVDHLLNELHRHSEMIKVKSKVNVCRDKKDNFLLSLCVDGKADYLLTGDDDLLTLKKNKKTSIIKMADYLRK